MDHLPVGSGQEVLERGHRVDRYPQPLLIEPPELVGGVADAAVRSTPKQVGGLPQLRRAFTPGLKGPSSNQKSSKTIRNDERF